MSVKITNFKSKIINNEYLSQYMTPFKIAYFESEEDVEKFEQKMCKGDDNTWMSWVSVKDKFSKFPCHIVFRYVYHKYSDDFTAVYLTLDEAKKDLENVILQLDKLNS